MSAIIPGNSSRAAQRLSVDELSAAASPWLERNPASSSACARTGQKRAAARADYQNFTDGGPLEEGLYLGIVNCRVLAALSGTQAVRAPRSHSRIRRIQARRSRVFIIPLVLLQVEPEDAGSAGRNVVVLSHALWMRRYAADANVLDKTIRIDGEAFTVVGVMPPAFNFPWNEVKLWLPMREDPATTARDATSSLVVGRLATGWTADAARDELTAIQRELADVYPEDRKSVV